MRASAASISPMVTCRSALRRWATGSGTDWAHSARASSRWRTQSARWASQQGAEAVRRRPGWCRVLADMSISSATREDAATSGWRVRTGRSRLGSESGELRRGPVLAASEDVESSQAAGAPVQRKREHHAAREAGYPRLSGGRAGRQLRAMRGRTAHG